MMNVVPFSCVYAVEILGITPGDWEWWALHIGSAVALTELTAYVCSRLESEEIVMPYHAPAVKTSSATANSGHSSTNSTNPSSSSSTSGSVNPATEMTRASSALSLSSRAISRGSAAEIEPLLEVTLSS